GRSLAAENAGQAGCGRNTTGGMMYNIVPDRMFSSGRPRPGTGVTLVPPFRHAVCSKYLLMRIRCPDCFCTHTHPVLHRWYEVPLLLWLVQPYQCSRCERRFLRPRMPDLPLHLFPGKTFVSR